MAEVMGILASAAGILSSLTTVIKTIDSMRSAPRDAQDVSAETRALKSVIENLQSTMQVSGARPSDHWLQTTDTVFSNALDASRRLEGEVTSAMRGPFSRVKWVLSSSDKERYCSRLRSYTSMLSILQGSIHWESSQRIEAKLDLVISMLADNGISPPAYSSSGLTSSVAAASSAPGPSPGAKQKRWPFYDCKINSDLNRSYADQSSVGGGDLVLSEHSVLHRVSLSLELKSGVTMPTYWLSDKTRVDVYARHGEISIWGVCNSQNLPLISGPALTMRYNGSSMTLIMGTKGSAIQEAGDALQAYKNSSWANENGVEILTEKKDGCLMM